MPPKQRGGKRPRPPSASTSASHSESPPSSPPPLGSTTAPWPRREGIPIRTTKVWTPTAKQAALSNDCLHRAISETWDDYDTLYYNAWLNVPIVATRFADPVILRRMGILGDVLKFLEQIGLGTMCTKHYHAYPDLVRQFLATISISYTNPAKSAHEGTLTFMLEGRRYRLSIHELCDIYGFEKAWSTAAWPSEFADKGRVWSSFATGIYDSKTAAQTDIRHPVVRYVARLIANTISSKSEPGKMRLHELMMLSYGVEHLYEEGQPELQRIGRVNFGALFAEHLVSLKTKPFSGTKKKPETVGSLLTPIFEHFRIALDHIDSLPAKAFVDEAYLKNAKWLKEGLFWCYRDPSGHCMVQLPNSDLTTITESLTSLHFLPEPPVRLTAPPVRSATGSTRRTSHPAADIASSSSAPPAFGLPPTPELPMEQAAFQRYMVESMQAIWSAIATLSRCGCVRAPATTDDAPADAPDDHDDDDAT